MTAQSTIVYADLCASVPQQPSAVAGSIASAAQDGAAAGQFDIELRSLSADEVRQAIDEYPSGHDRLSQDRRMILLDAGAMLAYAPYRARVLLSNDPFEHADKLSEVLSIDIDAVRVRLHDALLSAHSVMALGQLTFDAVTPLLSREPEMQKIPATSLLSSGDFSAPILVVNHEDDEQLNRVGAQLAEAFPDERFLSFVASSVFDGAWKAVLHLGIARSNLPGARLQDAWVGGVPAFQLVDPQSLSALRRRRAGQTSGLIVDHGRNGLLLQSLNELIATVGELLLDPLPARAVARNAKRRIDAPAEWDVLLQSILR